MYRRFLSAVPLLACAIGLHPTVLCDAQVVQARPGTLQNQDVVKMVQAGLDDALIISKIRTSPSNFQTDPDTLIQLKRLGVSGAIMQAMTEAGSPPPPANQPATNQVPPLPSGYGFYAFDGEYKALVPSTVELVLGLEQAGAYGIAVDGFSGNPPQRLTAPTEFLAYQQNIDIAAYKLAPLQLIKNMYAYEFNMLKTNPQFFSGIYRKGYNDAVPVNLWRPRPQGVTFRTEPVEGRNSMFRLVPQEPLPPGRYALFLGETIHTSDLVFAARPGLQGGTALYFEIASPTDSRNASCTTFDSCYQGATEAFTQKDWQTASTFVERALTLQPDRPEGYSLLGTLYLYKNDFNNSAQMWDKALQLGGTLQWTACHERTFDCERGLLTANSQEVTFTSEAGKVAFNVAPSEVAPASENALRIGRSAYLRVKVNKKNYNFYFWPDDVECIPRGMFIECDGMGYAQQAIITNYIIKRLALVRH